MTPEADDDKDRMRPYSRAELQCIRYDSWPDRGEFCQKCSQFIPAFEDLTESDIVDLRRLIGARRRTEAMRMVMDRTGCPSSWAKLWVLHPNGGSASSQEPTPPCPYCGSQLRTPAAQRCPSCHASWHAEQ